MNSLKPESPFGASRKQIVMVSSCNVQIAHVKMWYLMEAMNFSIEKEEPVNRAIFETDRRFLMLFGEIERPSLKSFFGR